MTREKAPAGLKHYQVGYQEDTERLTVTCYNCGDFKTFADDTDPETGEEGTGRQLMDSYVICHVCPGRRTR